AVVPNLLRVSRARLWGALHAALSAWSSVQGVAISSIAGIDASSVARLPRQIRRELLTIVGTANNPLALNTLRAQAMGHLVSGIPPTYATLAMIPALTTPMLRRLIASGYTNLASLLVGDASRDLHREERTALRASLEQEADRRLSRASPHGGMYDVEY